MSKISYVNGDYVSHEDAKVHIEDRSNQFSDGVYEVISFKNSIIINFSDHMIRFQRSLNELKISYHVDKDKIEKILKQLMIKNHAKDGAFYLQISRGVAPRNHLFPKDTVPPVLTVTYMQINVANKQDYEKGVKVITYPDMRWKRRDIKTVSLLPNILARQEAAQNDAIEAILIEEDNTVTEASSSNVFIVDYNGIIHTHPLSNLILGGVTRKNVINLCKQNNIVVKEEKFTKEQLFSAQEVFITSTTKYVMPVTIIDGKQVYDGKVGNITRKLITLYNDFITKQVA